MAESNNIENRVKQVVAKYQCIDPECINVGDTFESMSIDSLDMVAIVLDIEAEFGIDIPDYEIEKFMKVEDLLNYLVGELAA